MQFVNGTTDKRRGIGDRPKTLNFLHGYMHVCDWASLAFLPIIPCKGCSLAKIQHPSLSSLIRVPPHHFTYDTVLRDPHCERPYVDCPDTHDDLFNADFTPLSGKMDLLA
jgi:hypothetical protein